MYLQSYSVGGCCQNASVFSNVRTHLTPILFKHLEVCETGFTRFVNTPYQSVFVLPFVSNLEM